MAPKNPLQVVLVHGGFADGSGWEGVYQLLRKDGYKVSVVPCCSAQSFSRTNTRGHKSAARARSMETLVLDDVEDVATAAAIGRIRVEHDVDDLAHHEVRRDRRL